MESFEAGIYNQEVRDLVSQHLHHEFLEDVWADINYIEIRARDEDDARQKLERRYPQNQGYVITQILPA